VGVEAIPLAKGPGRLKSTRAGTSSRRLQLEIIAMNTKTHIVAAAAILTTLAMPSMASAQAAIVLPPSYSWNQMTANNVPADARDSVTLPTRHHESHRARPYGQW
jgi:hypothetical protein